MSIRSRVQEACVDIHTAPPTIAEGSLPDIGYIPSIVSRVVWRSVGSPIYVKVLWYGVINHRLKQAAHRSLCL